MASETGDENREITQYLTCMTENEKGKYSNKKKQKLYVYIVS